MIKQLIIILLSIFMFIDELEVKAQDEQASSPFPLDHFYAKRHKYALRSIIHRFTWNASVGYGHAIALPASQPNDLYAIERISSLPLSFSLHYNLLEKYRIGFGFGYEPAMLYKGRNPSDISNQQPINASILKYYLTLGVPFYQINKVLFVATLDIGGGSVDIPSDVGLINQSSQNFILFNGGVQIAYNFSEYISAFIQPSIQANVPLAMYEEPLNIADAIFYVGVGLSYRLPNLPRCYNRHCKAQINHVHGNKEYRSRVHTLFEKQNPGYGENYKKSKIPRLESKKLTKNQKNNWHRNNL